MITLTIQDKIRNGGAWALANSKSDTAHYFKSNPQIANSMISICWERLGKLDNAVETNRQPVCTACSVLVSLHRKESTIEVGNDH